MINTYTDEQAEVLQRAADAFKEHDKLKAALRAQEAHLSDERNKANEPPDDISNGRHIRRRNCHHASRQQGRCQAHQPQRVAIRHPQREGVQVPHNQRRYIHH
jgi:hypothetical protein